MLEPQPPKPYEFIGCLAQDRREACTVYRNPDVQSFAEHWITTFLLRRPAVATVWGSLAGKSTRDAFCSTEVVSDINGGVMVNMTYAESWKRNYPNGELAYHECTVPYALG